MIDGIEIRAEVKMNVSDEEAAFALVVVQRYLNDHHNKRISFAKKDNGTTELCFQEV